MTTTQSTIPSGYVLNAPHLRWPSGTEVTYSFAETRVDADRDHHFTKMLSESHREIFREAMDAWERVCGVRFRELDDSADANIRIGGQDIDGPYNTGGYSQFVYGGGSFGRILKNIIVIDTADWWDEVRLYDIALHELGHAIGIDHSDVYNQVMSGNQPTGPTPYYDQPGRDVLQHDDIAAARALWGTTPSGPSQTVFGTTGADTLFGGEGNDTIKGDFGNDQINGGGGDDVLAGNGVYWTHWNNPQDNYWSRTYNGANDRDTIFGGEGNDSINGNAGVDYLDGGPGNDTIFGGQNEGTWQPGRTRTNTIHLREGEDSLWGGDGDDFMNGNMGDDNLYGGNGNDLLRGGQDDDYLDGDAGDDTLYGDLEGDILLPGEGNDVLVLGNDPNYGDGARDIVFLNTADAGRDTIYGFEPHLDSVYVDFLLSTPTQVENLGLAVFHYGF